MGGGGWSTGPVRRPSRTAAQPGGEVAGGGPHGSPLKPAARLLQGDSVQLPTQGAWQGNETQRSNPSTGTSDCSAAGIIKYWDRGLNRTQNLCLQRFQRPKWSGLHLMLTRL